MPSFTSKATGIYDTAGQTTWNEVNFPVAGDDIKTQNTHVVSLDSDEACAGAVLDAGSELDLLTHAFANSIATDISGTLDIGATGTLVTVGLTFNAGSSGDFETGSAINNSGNLSIDYSSIWVNSVRASYTQTGSGNYNGGHWNNQWYDFTLNVTFTITLQADAQPTSEYGHDTAINGIVATAGFAFASGASASGSYVVGAAGNFTGAGTLNFYVVNGASPITNSRASAFSATGNVYMRGDVSRTIMILAWDFSNAGNYLLTASGAGISYFVSTSGIQKSKEFTFDAGSGETANLDNATNDPLFEWSNDVNLNSGTGTHVWGKGSGSITGTAISGTRIWDLNGLTVENLIYNCNGAIIDHQSAFTADGIAMTAGTVNLKESVTTTITDFDGTGGTIQSGSAGTQATVALTNAAPYADVSGVSFKDIAMNAANKINAKNNNINLGNTKGIVFEDSFGEM